MYAVKLTVLKRKNGMRPPQHWTSETDGNLTNNDQDKANIFKTHLSEVFRIPEDNQFDQNHFIDLQAEMVEILTQQYDVDLNGDSLVSTLVIVEDITNAILHQLPPIAVIHQLPPIAVLHQLPPIAVRLLSEIVNGCIQTSYYPSVWKRTVTIMIP
ncbi:hypothetical protein HHI36_021855 [Cryptolaemus montrouzieri]|uniref:Uncharacterized protein n=1 Tax=Cryptolaemus montrouzieri TaxID=559131 RepID=A0ABD2MY52_9CUCU